MDGEQLDRQTGEQTAGGQPDTQSDDIVKEKLPEYREVSFAIPDIEPESSFAENKDEIFRRNMIIAAKEARPSVPRVKYPENFDAEEIFPQDKLRQSDLPGKKKTKHGFFYRLLEMLMEHHRELRIIYLLTMVAIVTIMVVMISLAAQIRGGRGRNKELDIRLPQATKMVQYEEQYETVLTVTEITAENTVEDTVIEAAEVVPWEQGMSRGD